MNVMLRSALIRRGTMLLMLPVVLAGCSSRLPPSGSSSESITPLSALGRQPEKPAFCLPTCSANLSSETDGWQNTLTGHQKQVESVNGSTIR